MSFHSIPCWIRLYDLPIAGKTPQTLKILGRRFGEVLELDENNLDIASRCARLKILLDLQKPLKQGTNIRIGEMEPKWIAVKYERLPTFCYVYGHVGHTMRDCDMIQMAEELKNLKQSDMCFGEFMRAFPWKKNKFVIQENETEENNVRKSLFHHKNKIVETSDEDEGENHNSFSNPEVMDVTNLLGLE